MRVKNIAIDWIYHGSVRLWFTKVLEQPKRSIIVEDRCFSNEKIDRVEEVALNVIILERNSQEISPFRYRKIS